MLSIFGRAQESADNIDNQNDDTQSAIASNDAGLIEGAMEDHDEMMKTSDSVDELMDGEDKLNELVDVAAESYKDNGLTERGLRYLKIAFKNIVGKNIADNKTPAMESFAITHPMQVTAIALEGIADTIKQFWQAIKNQMGKFWNQTKSWYVKTFDVANKIIARAKALEDKSAVLATSPTEKTFEMSGITFLSVNYQVKEPAALIKGLGDMKNILDASLDNITKANQSNKTDAILNYAKAMLTQTRSDLTALSKGKSPSGAVLKENMDVTAQESGLIALIPNQTGDKEMLTRLGVAPGQVVTESAGLPGNRKLYNAAELVLDRDPTMDDVITSIKSHRLILSDSQAKPKEMEDSLDVKTLNSSQISQIAGFTGEMGETILGYKKEFEARDKFITNIIKGFDQIVKELDGTPVQQPAPKPQPTTTPAPSTQSTQPAPTPTPAPTPAPADTPAPAPAQPAATTQQADGSELDNPASPVDAVDKQIRKLANATLQQFKKEISLSGTILNHSIKVANAFLLYGERSLAQYGG